MRSFAVAAVALASISYVAAQSAASLPTCVLSCYTGSYGATTCTQTDILCLCQSATFQQAVGACLEKSCTSTADISAGVAFGASTCSAVGVTITTSALVAATGAASGSAAASSAPASASAVVSSAAAAGSSAGSSASAAATSAAAATTAKASSTAAAASSAAPAATTAAKSGASSMTAQGGLIAGMMALVFAL